MIRGSDLQHRHPITPYEGMILRGTVVKTILRGQTVYDRGVIFSGAGLMLERNG
jgi:allantoinase